MDDCAVFHVVLSRKKKKEKRGWVWVVGESTPEPRRTKEKKEEKADRKVPDRPVR
jgi:hypothetical protein